ncbi:MAG: PIN domain-containing protein [Nanoarchaeota archaeon]
MKLIIDTNRIIASLIKPQTSRAILFNKNFKFITPNFTLSEIMKYKEEIIRKGNLIPAEFDLLLFIIFEYLEIIPIEEYTSYVDEASKLMTDIKDVPFLALAIAYKADGIWSDDSDFKKQNKVKVYTTSDLANFFL